MRTETLHEVLHAAPFRPFTLCLADGTRVDVPHPDFIANPPGARIAVVMGRDESTQYTKSGKFCALLFHGLCRLGKIDWASESHQELDRCLSRAITASKNFND